MGSRECQEDWPRPPTHVQRNPPTVPPCAAPTTILPTAPPPLVLRLVPRSDYNNNWLSGWLGEYWLQPGEYINYVEVYPGQVLDQ